jgi:hypothetical protein
VYVIVQLYVVHTPIGDRAAACVYVLMEGKSVTAYENIFRITDTKLTALGCQLKLHEVITDFEAAAMKAVRHFFGNDVRTQGCFYHLTQSTWRKIQDLGLASEYRFDHTMREFCGMIDALAFLPVNRINDGVTYLQSIAPPSVLPLLQYFVQTYVSGDMIVGGVLRLVRQLLSLKRGMFIPKQGKDLPEQITSQKAGTTIFNILSVISIQLFGG